VEARVSSMVETKLQIQWICGAKMPWVAVAVAVMVMVGEHM